MILSNRKKNETRKQIYFQSRESFRGWLQKNHAKSIGIWIIFYKKHVNIRCIKYDEALEEALCYGWIDSIIKKVDDDRYLRKFTPRTNISKWSDLNKKIVLSLMKKGKMTAAGLKKIDVYLKTGKVDWQSHGSQTDQRKKELQIPEFILKAFAGNEPALTNFNKLAWSYQRRYILWITSAKRAATVQKRLAKSVILLKEDRKLGLK